MRKDKEIPLMTCVGCLYSFSSDRKYRFYFCAVNVEIERQLLEKPLPGRKTRYSYYFPKNGTCSKRLFNGIED